MYLIEVKNRAKAIKNLNQPPKFYPLVGMESILRGSKGNPSLVGGAFFGDDADISLRFGGGFLSATHSKSGARGSSVSSLVFTCCAFICRPLCLLLFAYNAIQRSKNQYK